MSKKPLTLIHKTWTDQINGNTYCATEIILNGISIGHTHCEGGQDRRYDVIRILRERGDIPDDDKEVVWTELFKFKEWRIKVPRKTDIWKFDKTDKLN